MSSALGSIYLAGNNPSMVRGIKKCLEKNNLQVENRKTKETDYRLFIYDVDETVENLSRNIIEELDDLNNYTGKVCLILDSNNAAGDPRIENLRSVVLPYLSDRKNNLRLVVTRDLYQEDGEGSIDQFENWLCQVVHDGTIDAASDGSVKYHPTSINDLTILVIKSLFITNTAGQIYQAVSEELTDLEIAYLLKKILEKKNLPFDINLNSKEKRESGDLMNLSIQTQAILNWIPKVNFADQLSSVIDDCLDKESEGSELIVSHSKFSTPKLNLHKLDPLKIETKLRWSKLSSLNSLIRKIKKSKGVSEERGLYRQEKNALIRIVGFTLVGMIILTVLPVSVSFTSLYYSTKETYRAFEEIRDGQEVKARDTLNRAKFFNRIASSTFQSIVPVGNLAAKETMNTTNDYLLILGHGQSLLDSVIDVYSLGDQLYQSLLGKRSADTKTLVAALGVNLVSVSERLSQIQLLFGEVELPFGYAERVNLDRVNQSINLMKSQISLTLPILDLLDKIAGNQALQRYLVVVQDTNELRPTGGFISSYGVITLDQGKVINFQIDSSLSLDRLVEGKIEPPGIVKQLLGQPNWSFHDSNLDADFANSSRQMSWFYQRFKSVTVDGVIGVNLYFIRNLLEQIGPVSLADGQSVTADNLFVLASNPTASKGLDVITALTQTLGEKLLSGNISLALISRGLLKDVAFGEVNLWFNSPLLESLAETSGLSGRVKVQDCHPQLASLNCRADTVYLNESNMSVNKLNYYLKRNQSLAVEIGESGEVNYVLGYDYTYPVPAPTNLGQTYKAYYQLFLPSSSQNVSLVLDGQMMDSGSLIQTSLTGLTKIEFSAGLSTNQNHHLEIRFTSPNYLDVKKQLIPYTLAILKQPGTLSDSLTVKIHYPNNFMARNMTVPLKQTGPQELVFQTSEVSLENLGLIFKNTSL